MNEIPRAYARLADRYIELFGSVAAVHPDDLAMIERHLSIGPGLVLDIGCGPGHLTAYLRSFGVDAVGVDPVPEFLAHTRSADPGGRYVRGSALGLPVTDGSVAGVLAWYSLIHLPPPDVDAALAELRRVTAPGAAVLVGFFDGDEIAPFEHKVVTAHVWPPDELSRRLRRAGFDEVERNRRPSEGDGGHRAHAAIAAVRQ